MSLVLVTRTGKSGEQLTEALLEQNIESWHVPTLEIKAEEILVPVEDFQQAIFISPNAVKFSVAKSQVLKDMLPKEVIAVGQGTAFLLKAAGFEKVRIPSQFNSEGLLELPELQSIKGQQIIIVKGRGGRTYLAEQLTKRGAICHYLDTYCRVSTKIVHPSWSEFLSSEQKSMVTIASVDTLEALNFNLGKGFNFDRLTLIVASQRIKESALLFGYSNIVVAKSASNSDMQTAIIELLDVQDKR